MPKLIVGLGNPGSQYTMTRHNAGFLLIDAYARKHRISFSFVKQWNGELGIGTDGEERVYLLKPQTYMNNSGISVQQVATFYKIPPNECLIIVDDIYVPIGSVRFRKEGSSGGHNGLKSIEEHLGTPQFPRMRVGVGQEESKKLRDHVLGNFSKEEFERLESVIESSLSYVSQWVHNSLGETTWHG